MAKPASKKSAAVIPARRLPASVTPGQKTVVVAEDTTVQHRFCFDREQRTCLVVSQDAEVTKFIPLETESGLCICNTSTTLFTERFRTVPNHSLSKGAAVYARYAREVGATPEVMAFLGHFTSLTPQEVAMATNRKKTNDETTATKKVAAKEKVAATVPVETAGELEYIDGTLYHVDGDKVYAWDPDAEEIGAFLGRKTPEGTIDGDADESDSD